jgi:hypothetical protein
LRLELIYKLTIHPHALNKKTGQVINLDKIDVTNEGYRGRQPQKRIQVLGCVPVQIVNLSLEEVVEEG